MQISNLILRTCAFFLLKRKNWTLKTGAKYGCDFMAYEGSEIKFHSKFGVLVFDCEKTSFKKIMRVQRILTSVKKVLKLEKKILNVKKLNLKTTNLIDFEKIKP